MKEPGFFANFDTTIVVALLLVIGFVITLVTVGPGAALRGFAAELVILVAAFALLRQYLPWKDAPKQRIQRPVFELAAGLVSYLLLIGGAYTLFSGRSAWPLLAAGILIPAAVMLVGRYNLAAWGLHWPGFRAVGVLAVTAAVIYALSWFFNLILPASEVAPATPVVFGVKVNVSVQELIANSAILSLVVAAFLEEWFFRVYLQPRLAAFWPGRWALFGQAVLFSLAYLPLYLSGNDYPLAYSIALGLVLSNGIMAGYFWRKTGNLPLLILLHLFAFSRFGL